MNYLVIRHEVGGWASVLPDFVGVTMRLEDVAKAIQRAVVAARSALEALKAIAARLPVPSNLDAVQRNYVWAPEDGIDWSKSVVRTVSWHLDDLTDKDPAQPPQKDNGRWPSRKRAAQKTFDCSGVTAMTATHASEPGQDVSLAPTHDGWSDCECGAQFAGAANTDARTLVTIFLLSASIFKGVFDIAAADCIDAGRCNKERT